MTVCSTFQMQLKSNSEFQLPDSVLQNTYILGYRLVCRYPFKDKNRFQTDCISFTKAQVHPWETSRL